MDRKKYIKAVANPTVKQPDMKQAVNTVEVIDLLVELLRGHGHLFTDKEIKFMEKVHPVKN